MKSTVNKMVNMARSTKYVSFDLNTSQEEKDHIVRKMVEFTCGNKKRVKKK